MKSQRTRLAGLQSRARAAAARHAENRVVVSRTAVAPADDGNDAAGAQPSSAELWLYGTVGGFWWGFDSDDVATALRGLGDVDEILVRLHSFGGSSIEGIAIANLLANHPATVRIVVDGLAASAASMIALAGAELIMSPGSQLMVHDAWMATVGNAAELRADADWIDKQSANYAETYAHRTSGTAESWRAIMLANDGAGTWYSAQEAVDAGLANRVANIASTTPPPPMPTPADLEEDPDFAAAAEWDLDVLIHPAARAAWSTWRHSTGAPKPPTASAGGSTETEGGSAVAFSDAQLTTMRDKLQLPADADETAIVNAVAAVVDESLEERPAQTGVPEGHVVIPAAQLETLQAGATAGAQAARTLHERDREAFLDANRAKFPAGLRESWAKQYDLNPEATVTALSAMPDLIPAELIGHEIEPDAGAANVKTTPAYLSWKE